MKLLVSLITLPCIFMLRTILLIALGTARACARECLRSRVAGDDGDDDDIDLSSC